MSERTINFDTHRFVKRLVESGLAEETAEILADEQSRLLTNNLASKSDLETGLAAVRADLETGLAATEARLMRWMAGLLIAQGGVIVTLISTFN
jgi:hypothetical protein